MRSGNFDRSGRSLLEPSSLRFGRARLFPFRRHDDRCVASIDPTLAVRHAALGGTEINLLPPTCLTGCDAINRTGGCPVKNPL